MNKLNIESFQGLRSKAGIQNRLIISWQWCHLLVNEVAHILKLSLTFLMVFIGNKIPPLKQMYIRKS